MPVRETVAMLGLAALGGTWAVAWGSRRLARPQRLAMVDARTQLQVRLDALRARTAMIMRHDGLPPDARHQVDEVVMQHVLIDSTLARAATAQEIEALRPQLDACLDNLAEAGAAAGLDLPADQPFAGLCANDPQHGVADATDGDGRRVCAPCHRAAAEGTPVTVRLIAREGRPVPFDQMDR